jgi:hypothetical protein
MNETLSQPVKTDFPGEDLGFSTTSGNEPRKCYIGLVHHPVYNKQKQVITTSITNMDIHDIARTAQTYGVEKYFIVNPLASQHDLYNKLNSFWQSDTGQNYQPDRAKALKLITFCYSLQEAYKMIENQEQSNPLVITTTAKNREGQMDYNSFSQIGEDGRPLFLLFGTGYGLTDEVHEMADHILAPIMGQKGYNHLSVRSAVAIILDRLIPINKGGEDGYIANG